MTVETYLGFVAASVVMILMPGPMVALIVSNAISSGRKAGLVTVAGAALGLSTHLVLVCAGLSLILATLGQAVFWLKWLGAAYLLYLGIRAVRAAAPQLSKAEDSGRSLRQVFAGALLVQLTNPKLLIFYAAFFPLFLSADAPALPQLLLLSATFLAIEIALDSAWALGAAKARPLLVSAGRWTNRITGGVLIAAAAGTAAMKRI